MAQNQQDTDLGIPGEMLMVMDSRTMGPWANYMDAQGFGIGEIFEEVNMRNRPETISGDGVPMFIDQDGVRDEVWYLIEAAKDSLRGLEVKWSWRFWHVCQLIGCPSDYEAYEPILRHEFIRCILNSEYASRNWDELLERWVSARQVIEQDLVKQFRHAEALDKYEIQKGMILMYEDLEAATNCLGKSFYWKDIAAELTDRCDYLDVIDGWLMGEPFLV